MQDAGAACKRENKGGENGKAARRRPLFGGLELIGWSYGVTLYGRIISLSS